MWAPRSRARFRRIRTSSRRSECPGAAFTREDKHMADFVGAIDQGTTSSRFMIFDHGGNEIGRHQLEHEQILPQAGWVEHSPTEIWERTRSVVETALTKTKLHHSDLAAIGITNQR